MRIGIRIPSAGPLADPDSLLAVALAAERLGYDSVWVTEHFALPDEYRATYAYTGSGRSWWNADSPHLEPLTTLAWIAGQTERLKVGTSVVVLPYRTPVVLAKMVATVDVLSRGRLIFGAGIGWLEPEFKALGVPIRRRVSRTREALLALRELLSAERPVLGGDSGFDGTLGFAPKPVQRPWPPIWIGGEAPAALERVAELGDGWHPGALTPEQMAPKLEELKEICAQRGRDFGELEISVRALPAMPWRDEYLDQYRELGVGHVVFDPDYLHEDVDAYVDEVERYARFIGSDA